MFKNKPEKIITTFMPMASEFTPVDKRKYTMVHSGRTQNIMITIGSQYDESIINNRLRDEVRAEWIPQLGQYVLAGRVYAGGHEFSEEEAGQRFKMFEEEMEHSLRALVSSDRSFLSNFPWLLDCPIYMQFESAYEEYNKMFYFGTPRQYLPGIPISKA
ncbi:staygreen family protein [Peribacillus sp. SCS-37]|uniref:staygreen family protein n=1 Tax=Paraperibacillus esterisolvens TaxID=3115296 RepID=UPI003905DDF6